jgi:hypothetical protein
VKTDDEQIKEYLATKEGANLMLREYLPRLDSLAAGYDNLTEQIEAVPERKRHLMSTSLHSARANKARVQTAAAEIKRALASNDIHFAKAALDEVKRVLSDQTSALELLSKPLLDEMPSTGRAMLSAVESTSIAYGSTQTMTMRGVRGGATIPAVIGRASDTEVYADAGDYSGKSWFDEAIESVRTTTDGKLVCPLIIGDVEEMWDRVYWGEAKHESAASAIRRHLEEFDGASYHVAKGYGPRAVEAVKLARMRLEALLHDLKPDPDPVLEEKRLRLACIITATEVNIELTAIAWSELSKRKGKVAHAPIGGQGDIAHGFDSRPIASDSSSAYQRNMKGLEGRSDHEWTYSVWRMAMETAAYPNISDTLDAMCKASEDAAKQMLNPPDGPPANVEVRLMQVGYWAAMVCAAADKESRKAIDNGYALRAFTWLARVGEQQIPRIVFDAVDRVRDPGPNSAWSVDPKAPETSWQNRRVEFRGLLRNWSCQWRESGYARIDVGHKLAAALMFTDVKDDLDVRAPWSAFSVHIPPGITRVSRVLVISGTEDDGGYAIRPLAVIFDDGSLGECTANHLDDRELDLLHNLVRGVCLAAEQGHAERAGNHGATGSKGGKKRFAKGPGAGERYQLAAPVKIDLRDAVVEHLSGVRTGRAPKVQFIVRGHWRNQVFGPGRTGRKRIWIEPFWKGDEAARVLLRSHHVEGDKLKVNPG